MRKSAYGFTSQWSLDMDVSGGREWRIKSVTDARQRGKTRQRKKYWRIQFVWHFAFIAYRFQ